MAEMGTARVRYIGDRTHPFHFPGHKVSIIPPDKVEALVSDALAAELVARGDFELVSARVKKTRWPVEPELVEEPVTELAVEEPVVEEPGVEPITDVLPTGTDPTFSEDAVADSLP